jgi:hypothetical protein
MKDENRVGVIQRLFPAELAMVQTAMVLGVTESVTGSSAGEQGRSRTVMLGNRRQPVQERSREAGNWAME